MSYKLRYTQRKDCQTKHFRPVPRIMSLTRFPNNFFNLSTEKEVQKNKNFLSERKGSRPKLAFNPFGLRKKTRGKVSKVKQLNFTFSCGKSLILNMEFSLKVDDFQEDLSDRSRQVKLLQQQPKTQLENISNFQTHPQQFKLLLLKNLVVILNELEDEAPLLIPQLLDKIHLQSQSIKLKFLQIFPGLAQLVNKIPQLNQKNILIPLLVKIMADQSLQVKEKAAQLISDMIVKSKNQENTDMILKQVLQMAHDQVSKENRIVAVQLLSKLSSSFGKQLCQQYIGLQILSLGQDINPMVRKQSVLQLPSVASVVGRPFFTNRFMQFYRTKSEQKVWGIRKACAQIIIQISEICQPSDIETQLLPIYLKLLADQHKWVKVESYKYLGHFIHKLGCFNQRLLKCYSDMVDPAIYNSDTEIPYQCAYNFPAVLLAFGNDRWKYLQPTYLQLVKFSDHVGIKTSVASSIHQLARILGPQITKTTLFPVLQKLLIDQNQEVCLMATRKLYEILDVFKQQSERESIFDIFLSLQSTHRRKWRVRQAIAQQIGYLCQMFSPQNIKKYIIPISFKLLNDEVAIVRFKAAERIGQIMEIFIPGKQQQEDQEIRNNLDFVIYMIMGYGMSKSSNQRLIFVKIVENVIKYQQIFVSRFFQTFSELAKDRVSSVRITMAMVLRKVLEQVSSGVREELLKICWRLREDVQPEIGLLMKQIAYEDK